MSVVDHAAPAAQGTDLEFVIEELHAVLPEAVAGEDDGCGCVAF